MNSKNNSYMKTHVIFSALFIILILLDRLTKQWATSNLMSGDITVWDGVFKLHYLENRGAAWGLFENAFWLFYIITAVAVVIMGYLYSKLPFKKKYLFLRICLVALCAGAVGNFIDRAFFHYVIDFLYLEIINFPVFNVADIYVTVSVILIVFSFLFVYCKDKELFKSDSE